MTRYAPLAGSPDIELNAAGTEAKLVGGGPMRTETRPRTRERSRHPLVLAGIVIVLLVVYSGWHWRPHPPHPPRDFYGPPTLPPHLRREGPVPGPASVRAPCSIRNMDWQLTLIIVQLLTSAAPAKSYHKALRSDLRYLT